MNARRRRLTEGTEVLWSTVTYVPVILVALLLIDLSAPVLAPYAGENKPVPDWFFNGLMVFFVVGTPLALRHMVWRPLRQLAQDVGDRAAMRAYIKDVTLRAFPYIPLMAVPVALLCLMLDSMWFWPQLAAIIVIDHLVDKWRQRPISEAVDHLMARPSGR